ncbi:MAG: HK97 gp10 family phage protein [Acidaminococcaceae bacterium]
MSGGFRVNVKVPELNDAIAKLGTYSGKMALKVEEAISDSTKSIGQGAKNRVPVARGTLKKSIRTKFNKKTCTGEVYAKAQHAHLIEFGVKASIAKPTDKKVMAIDVQGQRFFRRKANIPARSARPFMRPAFEDEKPNLIRNVEKAVRP